MEKRKGEPHRDEAYPLLSPCQSHSSNINLMGVKSQKRAKTGNKHQAGVASVKKKKKKIRVAKWCSPGQKYRLVPQHPICSAYMMVSSGVVHAMLFSSSLIHSHVPAKTCSSLVLQMLLICHPEVKCTGQGRGRPSCDALRITCTCVFVCVHLVKHWLFTKHIGHRLTAW